MTNLKATLQSLKEIYQANTEQALEEARHITASFSLTVELCIYPDTDKPGEYKVAMSPIDSDEMWWATTNIAEEYLPDVLNNMAKATWELSEP